MLESELYYFQFKSFMILMEILMKLKNFLKQYTNQLELMYIDFSAFENLQIII